MTNEVETTTRDRWGGRERRKEPRKKSLRSATLLTNAGSFDCRVLDFSRAGAKVESQANVAPEQAVTLILKPIGTFAGLVAWCGDSCFGMRFMTQHGAEAVCSAGLTATPHTSEKPGSQSDLDEQKPPRLPRAASVNALLPNDFPCHHPGTQTRVRKSRGLAPKRSLAVRRGDIICLLRKKSRDQTSTADRSPGVSGDVEALALKDIAICELVEMEGRHFIELIEQKAAFAVTLLRVASSDARGAPKSADIAGVVKRIDFKLPAPARLDASARLPPSSARRPLFS